MRDFDLAFQGVDQGIDLRAPYRGGIDVHGDDAPRIPRGGYCADARARTHVENLGAWLDQFGLQL